MRATLRLAVLVPSLALGVALAAGCVTRTKSKARAQEAYQAGRMSATQPAPVSVSVTVVGPVRHRNLLWAEGMTLSRAILGAEYLLDRDPSAIFLTRGTETLQFSAQQLLGGNEGPVLLPGDVIELRP